MHHLLVSSRPVRLFAALVAALTLTVPLSERADAHNVVCYPYSSCDQWVWGSSGICSDAVDYITTNSSLYKWNGSSYDYEMGGFDACFACQNSEAIEATPSGTGWRWVEGNHTAYHHTLAPAISSAEFYRP